jgi:hypothetical protein
MAWNTVYFYRRCIVNSWLYWQDSMDDWKMADHYLSCPCGYFPDPVKTIPKFLPFNLTILAGKRRTGKKRCPETGL